MDTTVASRSASNSGAQTLPLKEKQPKIETAIFVLKDQRPSGFIKEGTQGTRHEEELSAPLRLRMPNTGVRVHKEPNGSTTHIRIRYIKNCPEIDVELQDKKGYKPSNDLETDQIYFLSGVLPVANDGETKTLFRFMTENIEFEEAPNRPENAETPLYYRHNKEKISEEILKNHALISKANGIVQGLYWETTGGFDYDEEKIDFLCVILGVKAEDYPSKAATLLEYARVAPERIVKSLDDHKDKLRAEVMYARTLNVLRFDDGKLIHCATDETVHTFSKKAAKDENVQMEEMIQFLTATDMGAQYYSLMKQATEEKRAEQLNAK